MPKNESGKAGETAAVNYLIKKGYKIVGRNVRYRVGELDIVAYDGSCLVFVEVKTRKSHSYGRPSEFVDSRKRQKLESAALLYTEGEDVELRFDVIEVTYEMYHGMFLVKEINHIENAF